MLELTQITIYPVKSCKGISLTRAELTPYGLRNDRRWMVVDSDNSFLSQRTVPRMALIEPSITKEGLSLRAPGMSTLDLSLTPAIDLSLTVTIWNDICQALDCGNEPAGWLSTVLGVKSRLVTFADSYERFVNPKYSGNRDQVGFADAFPLLLISSASLRNLNERLDQPVPMNRFRPNLVVSGCEPYEEDRWQQIAVGDKMFIVSKPCARCTVPTVNQSTGERGSEPLTTLAQYRSGNNNAVFFGQNLINEQKSGEIVLGTAVSVLESA